MDVKGVSMIAFVLRKQGNDIQFLMLRRTKERGGFWQSVSGTIKAGETAVETALREVEEETGLKPKRYWVADAVNIFYQEGTNMICVEPCFGVEVGEGKVKVSDEHVTYRWCAPDEALRLLPFKGNQTALIALCRMLGITLMPPDEAPPPQEGKER